ncbi:hypothetical protein B0T21DRAFT_411501 [Apiosordaria backusii]|uniref:Uncharacterized protein n=1 Tax=Apiosordaria backusii TaxID=314023 RepID=A0AA40BL96_9PEZI|nr:hypothetical protein B0T21DRAFT_411501 [Apiosordaria backusii]
MDEPIDLTNIDDSPVDLDEYLVPVVKPPTYRVPTHYYRNEYQPTIHNGPPPHQEVRQLDDKFIPVPPKPIHPSLMLQMRNDYEWSDVWGEVLSPYFLYPNFKVPTIRCFACARPLKIPLLQEPDGPFKLETDAEFEDAVVFRRPCLHLLGRDCAMAWLRYQYPTDNQTTYFRWINGEISPDDFDEELERKIKPIYDNDGSERTVFQACPICHQNIQVQSNYGDTTMDRDAAEYTWIGVKRVNLRAYEDIVNLEPNPMAKRILHMKVFYYKEVRHQEQTWSALNRLRVKAGLPEVGDVQGGPYNALDFAYLRNKKLQAILTNHVGDALFEKYRKRKADETAMEVDEEGQPQAKRPRRNGEDDDDDYMDWQYG